MDVVPPDPPLSDSVVTLRPWEEDDVRELADGLDGDDEIARWMDSIPQPYTEDEARAWVMNAKAAWDNGDGCPFAVVDASSGALLGGIGVRWIDAANQVGEVGYWARRDARGRGLTTRALRLIGEWALGPLGCERLVLRADTGNAASQRVAERAGFVREGIQRSVRFNARVGRRVDFVVYSRLPSD
jgi:RimJ/RimL family protein N-acetyltransferase